MIMRDCRSAIIVRSLHLDHDRESRARKRGMRALCIYICLASRTWLVRIESEFCARRAFFFFFFNASSLTDGLLPDPPVR